jgi:hypothetical protein
MAQNLSIIKKSVSVFGTKKYAFIVGITWSITYTVWAITEFPVVTTSGVYINNCIDGGHTVTLKPT